MTDNLLKLTKAAFIKARKSMVEAMQFLYAVHEEGAWKEVAETWGDYLTQELDVQQSQASLLLGINRHFLVEGGMEPADIEGIDIQKLHAARSLPGTVEEQVAKAATLSRAELRAERQDAEPHPFDPKEICKICGATKENHT